MGVSKKKVKQNQNPKSAYIRQEFNPDAFYEERPSWNFNSSDLEAWSLTQNLIGNVVWSELIPKLKSFETQTWNEILQIAKKQNHSIDIGGLNPIAQKRLTEKRIEVESIISLRLSGTHRLYGFMRGSVFHILWYDLNHGDNNNCVCRSYKKHT